MRLSVSGILRLYESNVLPFSLTNGTFANITAAFLTISSETVLTHHYMSTTCIDHAGFIIKAKFALLLIVVFFI